MSPSGALPTIDKDLPVKKSELEEMHLSQLHSLAAEAGLERYRMLRREQLVEKLVNGADESDQPAKKNDEPAKKDEGEGSGSRRSRRSGPARNGRDQDREGRRRRRGEEGRSRRSRGDDDDSDNEQAEQKVAGPLQVLASGEGVVHGSGGEEASVSAAQIRRCELREGDLVAGPAKSARRGERRLALVRVEKVNGAEPVEDRGAEFEDLTAATPTRSVTLKIESGDVLVRAADLIAPLAHGHRVLVRAERRSGRSSLLRSWARAIAAGEKPPAVIALLVDERPEEVTEWRQQVEAAEIVDAGADLTSAEQVRRARLALAGAKRRAESGQDVVLIVDSLTRLAVAAGDPSAVKPFFGAGRDLTDAGSLTVIGVVLKDGQIGDDVDRAVTTTESTSLDLSAELAAEGIVPAFVAIRPSVGGEELLREGEALASARRLRSELALLAAADGARRLAERIAATKSNEDLLR